MRDDYVFVFGSNLAGRHGKGAAKTAKDEYGAIEGIAAGLQGRAYGIPTKDGRTGTAPLSRPGSVLSREAILPFVQTFGKFTFDHPELDFMVTRVGCGLAGYKDKEIAGMFAGCNPNNTYFDLAWAEYLPIFFKKWGTL